MIRALALAAFVTTAAVPAAAEPTAIVGGRVVSATRDGFVDIEVGTVVFNNGRITAVGADVNVPDDARVIDAGGQVVTAGLFAPLTSLGLIEVGAETSTNDREAATSPFSAALDAAAAFNANSTMIASTRIEGVTRAAITSVSARDMFAGQGALIDTSGQPDSIFAPHAFFFAEMDEGAVALAGGSRQAAWAYLDAAFGDVRNFPRRYANGGAGDVLHRYDAAALTAVVEDGAPLILNVNRASDIREAIAFQERSEGVSLILYGAAEAGAVAEELAAARIPVLIDPLNNLPYSFDALGAEFDTINRLEAAGVDYAIALQVASSGTTFNARLLPQHAGGAVAHGLSWELAIEAITLAPARIFGVDNQLGGLERGKIADVVIWDGDPLEVMSAPVMVFIDGEETSLTSRQTRLRDRYQGIAEHDGRPPAYIRP